jgi:hypothetical protein
MEYDGICNSYLISYLFGYVRFCFGSTKGFWYASGYIMSLARIFWYHIPQIATLGIIVAAWFFVLIGFTT